MSTTDVHHPDGPEPDETVTQADSGTSDSASAESGQDTMHRSLGQRGTLLAAFVASLIVIVDQSTKTVALDRLTLGRPVHVIGTLDWNLVYNRGSAFGLGQSLGPIIGVFAFIVAIAMLVLAAKAPRPSYALVYGIVAGGALGNVLDRIFRAGTCPGTPCDGFLRGAVIDFIDLNWWPVFNVADMAIVCGVIAVAVGSILAERS